MRFGTYYFLQAPGLMPFTRNVTVANPPFPNALNAIPPTAPVDFTAMQFNAKSPTRYSYNLTIQRDLGWQTAVMVAYVGSQSRYLGRTGNQNTFFPQISSNGRVFWPAGLTQRPNPNFRSISVAQFDAKRLGIELRDMQAAMEKHWHRLSLKGKGAQLLGGANE